MINGRLFSIDHFYPRLCSLPSNQTEIIQPTKVKGQEGRFTPAQVLSGSTLNKLLAISCSSCGSSSTLIL